MADTATSVSQFSPDAPKPCVSGHLAQVTTIDGTTCDPEGNDCLWDDLWGGGIGLSLNQPEGVDEPQAWNAKAWGVLGFRFERSGALDGARLRFVALDKTHSEEFCQELEPAQREIKLTDLTPECWERSAESWPTPLDLSSLKEVRWQLVPDEKRSHRIDDFCIEHVEAVEL